MIEDDHLLRGAFGYAGEFGHLQISSSPVRDYSGIPGTLEAIIRRDDLLELFKLFSATDEELEREILSATGPRVLKVLHQQINDLGRGVGALATIFNPQVVILGGFLQSLFKLDSARLLGALRANSIASAHEGLVVRSSQLGSAAVLIGAAELAWTPLLENPAGTELHAAVNEVG